MHKKKGACSGARKRVNVVHQKKGSVPEEGQCTRKRVHAVAPEKG